MFFSLLFLVFSLNFLRPSSGAEIVRPVMVLMVFAKVNLTPIAPLLHQ